ncbi:hypothetical protein [Saccharospirillum mangrovi]|uniref:hypothetical protein n=1 Tax=Saccharospirillum mangrovi TaxID=2161747 RepID=UPI000D3A541C|nr:hypothetical protein [Saccharospirillum mangrovi]
MLNLPDIPHTPKLQMRSRLGYKIELAENDNSRYNFSAFPFDVGLRLSRHCDGYDHLGCGFFIEAGATKLFAAQYERHGASAQQVEFETTPGLNVKAGWHFLYLGYTQQTFQSNGNDLDASYFNFGIEVPLPLGDRWRYGDVF